MLPPNTLLKVKKQVLYWKNASYWLTKEEAEVLFDAIKRILSDPLVSRMIVDNREASGSWTSSIEIMWDDLLLKLSEHFDICATLENRVTADLMNKFSKDSGVLHKVRAFEDPKKAMAFVGISSFPYLGDKEESQS